MANIKTTPNEWATARAMFEQGHKLATISEKTGASVPSVSKRAKAEKWKRIRGAAPEVLDVPVPDQSAPGRNADIAKQVEALASLGLIDEEIAAIVDIPADTLCEYYARELKTASPRLIAKVAQSLYRMATDQNKPSVQAAIYWLDKRGGPGWAGSIKKDAGGKKGEIKDAAKKAAGGKYGPSAPPKLVAVKK